MNLFLVFTLRELIHKAFPNLEMGKVNVISRSSSLFLCESGECSSLISRILTIRILWSQVLLSVFPITLIPLCSLYPILRQNASQQFS